ncbi:type 2A phosphatase activator TIP41 [Clavulina sp. PMI_390]|nr:type 2A phosphatase activator TIP41 [Clavulina sp. PMI_390]
MSMASDHELTTTSGGTMIRKGSWEISSSTLPISNSIEISQIQDALDGLPLPEMPFGNNSLVITNQALNWKYEFTTLEALRGVKLGELQPGDGGVQVGYAKEWLQSRSSPSSANPMPKVVQAKPFDWTFTTTYSGHISSQSGDEPDAPRFVPGDPSNTSHRIPIEELSRPDPILFYAEIPLFEDELHDNGAASYMIRARVMPTSFFALARFSLRVDGVLFRIHDTRIYHSFASNPPLIVRETSGWEASYKTIKNFLPTPDLSPLTNSDFVYRAITSLPKSRTQNPDTEGGTGWRGLGTRIEVLELPANGISTGGSSDEQPPA